MDNNSSFGGGADSGQPGQTSPIQTPPPTANPVIPDMPPVVESGVPSGIGTPPPAPAAPADAGNIGGSVPGGIPTPDTTGSEQPGGIGGTTTGM